MSTRSAFLLPSLSLGLSFNPSLSNQSPKRKAYRTRITLKPLSIENPLLDPTCSPHSSYSRQSEQQPLTALGTSTYTKQDAQYPPSNHQSRHDPLHRLGLSPNTLLCPSNRAHRRRRANTHYSRPKRSALARSSRPIQPNNNPMALLRRRKPAPEGPARSLVSGAGRSDECCFLDGARLGRVRRYGRL